MKLWMGFLAAVIGLMVIAPSASASDYNCDDFANQAEAQKHLLPGDPYGLDAENDGIACESLPCPCSSARPGSGGGGGTTKPKPPRIIKFSARVVRVIDGETLDVRSYDNHKSYRIKLIGVSAPEAHGQAQCGGREASALLRDLATGRVKVKTDRKQPKHDSQGRLLAYVSHGADVGKRLISKGRARVRKTRGKFSRISSYKSAERRARAADRGSWSECRGF